MSALILLAATGFQPMRAPALAPARATVRAEIPNDLAEHRGFAVAASTLPIASLLFAWHLSSNPTMASGMPANFGAYDSYFVNAASLVWLIPFFTAPVLFDWAQRADHLSSVRSRQADRENPWGAIQAIKAGRKHVDAALRAEMVMLAEAEEEARWRAASVSMAAPAGDVYSVDEADGMACVESWRDGQLQWVCI